MAAILPIREAEARQAAALMEHPGLSGLGL